MNAISRTLFLFSMAIATSCLAQETGGMAPINDDELGVITAGAGIAFNMEFRLNALADGSADTCPTVGSATTCRMAFDLAGRYGAWLVFKSYRGITRLRNINVNAASLPSSWSSYTNNGSSPNPYLNGYDPRSRPSMQWAAGRWITAKATSTSALNQHMNSSAFTDMSAGLNISQVSAEFDCGSAVNIASGIYLAGCSSGTPGWNIDRVPGYLRDAVSGSAISLRYADGAVASSAPMAVRLDGQMNVFGY